MLKKLRSSRQLLFVTFGALLALAVNIPWIAQNLAWPGSLIFALLGWTLIAFVMRWNWRTIEDKDEKIGSEEERIAKEQTQAIVAALQKYSEAIIKAMREPLDGHE